MFIDFFSKKTVSVDTQTDLESPPCKKCLKEEQKLEDAYQKSQNFKWSERYQMYVPKDDILFKVKTFEKSIDAFFLELKDMVSSQGYWIKINNKFHLRYNKCQGFVYDRNTKEYRQCRIALTCSKSGICHVHEKHGAFVPIKKALETPAFNTSKLLSV